MKKLRCFYAPSPANEKVIAKFLTCKRFENIKRKYEFISLNPDYHKRKRQLVQFKGKAVFMWGSGGFHHESYRFTKNTGVKLKINFDYHTDYYRNYRKTDGINCGDHMSATELDGIKIMIGPSDSDIKRDDVGNIMDKSEPLRKKLEVIERAKVEGILYEENEIAVTVDADAILGFPVLWAFAAEDTIPFELFLEAIEILGPRIFRLDLGGLVDTIPDFQMNGFNPLVDVPSFPEVLAFEEWCMRDYCKDSKIIISDSEILIPEHEYYSKIGSFAVNVYAKFLETYANACAN